MDAKNICAPESTVKIPRKICKKRNIKINKTVLLKKLKSLFLYIIVAIKINSRMIKYAKFLCRKVRLCSSVKEKQDFGKENVFD